ncbi:hypothetical protein [Pseudomonas sp. PS01297]|uniref:hypothetical protein n=1 Tax=Pseudomonas sp. PS01297 TaxID=2991433 RepID=UPI00249ADB92|nr:hypothetical protein [Pseudomonas sp. PS01297]
MSMKALPNSPEQPQGKPVGYISQKALDKLVTYPMSSACIDGYAMYKNSIALYSHPEQQPPPISDGTTSDKYRAELYDEVWQKARDMGFANVTDALEKLTKPVAVVLPDRKTAADWRYMRKSDGEDAANIYNSALDDVARLNGLKP